MFRLPGEPLYPEEEVEEEPEEEPEEDPEEEPEEDPEGDPEEDPEQDLEEEAEEQEEEQAEEIPLDGQGPEEGLTDEEIEIPPPPPVKPWYPSYLSHGRGPPPMSAMPRSLPDIAPFLTQSIYGQRRKATDEPPRYEIGESSRAPQRAAPTPLTQTDRLPSRVREDALRATRPLEQRVQTLEEETRQDSNAIQTLYHRMGASRTEANHNAMTVRALQYEIEVCRNRQEVAENRTALVEEELRELRQHLNDLVDFVNRQM